jgi:hypothetical protein
MASYDGTLGGESAMPPLAQLVPALAEQRAVVAIPGATVSKIRELTGSSREDIEEPLLQKNTGRFVIFPVEHPDVVSFFNW